MPASDLEERIKEVCGQLNAAHALLVELVAEAQATDGWAGSGIRSLRQWLTWQASVAGATADKLMRLAEARTTHPVTTAVFAEGGLTLDQAAVAVTVPPRCDATIAELAPQSTVAQIAIEARVARSTCPAAPATEPPTESLSLRVDDDGRFQLRGELDADHGRVVDAALHAARDRLFHAGQTDVTWVDAFVDAMQRSLHGESVARRERFRVNVFLDPTADIPTAWSDGSAVPGAIARHLTCDGTLTPVFTATGRPVGVGRAQHVVPDRTRRLVERRDRKCRVPWCPHTRWLQVHHIVHWEDGGVTELANLAALCPACHRQHHRGQLGISGNAEQPDGLTFTDAGGHVIDPATRPIKPTGPPPSAPRPYRHPTGERLEPRWLWFPPAPHPHAA